jgi:hypothetical protein
LGSAVLPNSVYPAGPGLARWFPPSTLPRLMAASVVILVLLSYRFSFHLINLAPRISDRFLCMGTEHYFSELPE